MHLELTRSQRKPLVQSQIPGSRETNRHPFALERGGNHTRARFEGCVPCSAGFLRNKTGETSRPIAAHFSRAPVAVVKFPRPVGLPGAIWDQEKQAVGPDPALAMAQLDDL